MHGDNFNGVILEYEKAIKIAKDDKEIIFLFSKEGFIGSGVYNKTVKFFVSGH